jgi:hypothetical protein
MCLRHIPLQSDRLDPAAENGQDLIVCQEKMDVHNASIMLNNLGFSKTIRHYWRVNLKWMRCYPITVNTAETGACGEVTDTQVRFSVNVIFVANLAMVINHLSAQETGVRCGVV